MIGKIMKKKVFLAASLFLSAAATCMASDLPIPSLTPGAINSDVTQENIHSTVCVKGWTKTVRPPKYYTNDLKRYQIRQYRYADTDPRDYEEDHLIPLSVGGNPTSPSNLWPQPRNSEWGADRKDELEYAISRGVCSGEVSLAEARQAFATNWIDAYRRYESLRRRYHHGGFSD
jgi:hypothetical protein